MRIKGFALSLAVVFAVGCGEQPASPTVPNGDAVTPAFTIENAPVESGIVMRGESWVAVGWTDQKEGTFVFIGIDPRDFCSGTFDPDIAPMQEVTLPGDRGTLQRLHGQDLTTTEPLPTPPGIAPTGSSRWRVVPRRRSVHM